MKKLTLFMISAVFIAAAVFFIDNYKVHLENEPLKDDILMKNKDLREATFAGGCFWCMEPPFENLKGVKSVISGYTGGNTINPAYEEVSSGKTGHYEAVRVIYDPDEVSYGELLNVFWKNIDPTDEIGQFADRGTQYRTAVFYHSRKEKELAEASKDELAASGKFDKPIKTEILEAKEFYPAEDYHQDYYRTNPVRYNLYKKGSGRSSFLEDKWEDEENMGIDDRLKNFKKPPDKELKELLTPEQYRVTREEGTELACSGGLTENKGEGIYVDIVSGEPLFSSKDKFDSGTGWPSFTRPLEPDNIVTKEDKSLFRERTEVRSRYADSHLGHVFKDGPGPDGLRYCINSAALRFIPKEKLKEEGYGKYSELFKDKK